MNFHRTVLLQEVVEGLKVRKNQKYIDATLGGGGHTRGILKRGALVLGIDADPEAIEYVKENFKFEILNLNLKIVRENFRDIKKIAGESGFEKVSGIIFDLGVSSHQIDVEKRGFSYQGNAPLDMRMDPNLKLKASDLVNLLNKNELYEIFNKFGEEPRSRAISSAIERKRKLKSIQNAEQLVGIIAEAYKIRRFSPVIRARIAKKVFQALRIAVNDELGSLAQALEESASLLLPKARLAVISFHSLEDGIVKNTFIDFKNKGLGTILTPKPILPNKEELEENKRSRSAKLRIFEKK